MGYYLLGFIVTIITFGLGAWFGYRLGISNCDLDDFCVKGNE